MRKRGILEEAKRDIRSNKLKATVYFVLRLSVVLMLIAQLYNKNYNDVFLCVLTLFLFMVPTFVDKRLNIELPNTLEIIILLFIYAAEILGEIREYYLMYDIWDEILHTTNGFLCAALGFAMIDILNRSNAFHFQLSPKFVAMISFCFSMTIGVLWEFFEFFMDQFAGMDMQKDTILTKVTSVALNAEGRNVPVTVETDSLIVNGTEWAGYLDIGLIDTMSDLFVNFIGAVIFSIFGYFYIKNRGKGTFIERFIPRRKKDKNEEHL